MNEASRERILKIELEAKEKTVIRQYKEELKEIIEEKENVKSGIAEMCSQYESNLSELASRLIEVVSVENMLSCSKNLLQTKQTLTKEGEQKLDELHWSIWGAQDRFCDEVWKFADDHDFCAYLNQYPNVNKTHRISSTAQQELETETEKEIEKNLNVRELMLEITAIEQESNEVTADNNSVGESLQEAMAKLDELNLQPDDNEEIQRLYSALEYSQQQTMAAEAELVKLKEEQQKIARTNFFRPEENAFASSSSYIHMEHSHEQNETESMKRTAAKQWYENCAKQFKRAEWIRSNNFYQHVNERKTCKKSEFAAADESAMRNSYHTIYGQDEETVLYDQMDRNTNSLLIQTDHTSENVKRKSVEQKSQRAESTQCIDDKSTTDKSERGTLKNPVQIPVRQRKKYVTITDNEPTNAKSDSSQKKNISENASEKPSTSTYRMKQTKRRQSSHKCVASDNFSQRSNDRSVVDEPLPKLYIPKVQETRQDTSLYGNEHMNSSSEEFHSTNYNEKLSPSKRFRYSAAKEVVAKEIAPDIRKPGIFSAALKRRLPPKKKMVILENTEQLATKPSEVGTISRPMQNVMQTPRITKKNLQSFLITPGPFEVLTETALNKAERSSHYESTIPPDSCGNQGNETAGKSSKYVIKKHSDISVRLFSHREATLDKFKKY